MRTSKRTQSKRIRGEKSSGNVFADLGLPHPEQELLKSRLTLQIYRLIKARGLKQAEAGKILGIKQPHVSALMRNRSGSFSVERLMEISHCVGAGRGDYGETHAEAAWGNVGGSVSMWLREPCAQSYLTL